jgi:hypothetical protein
MWQLENKTQYMEGAIYTGVILINLRKPQRQMQASIKITPQG